MTGHIERLIQRYPDLAPVAEDIRRVTALLIDTFHSGGKLLVCGNGGSAADSEHIVGELMKGYMLKRGVPQELRDRLARVAPDHASYVADHLQGALPAISLVSHVALMTAFANDVAADMVFAQQVYGYGRPGDALLALSTSGNARNVVYALEVARALGLRTVGLTGQTGGAMFALCDAAVRIPATATPEIQERHLAVYHVVCLLLEEAFFLL